MYLFRSYFFHIVNLRDPNRLNVILVINLNLCAKTKRLTTIMLLMLTNICLCNSLFLNHVITVLIEKRRPLIRDDTHRYINTSLCRIIIITELLRIVGTDRNTL